MNDDKLKQLFDNFSPQLPSDQEFISRLESRLDSVEMIRRHNLLLQKRNRRALILASAAGFIAGIMFTLAIPYLNSLISGLAAAATSSFITGAMIVNVNIISWFLSAAMSVAVALSVYELYIHSMPKEQLSLSKAESVMPDAKNP